MNKHDEQMLNASSELIECSVKCDRWQVKLMLGIATGHREARGDDNLPMGIDTKILKKRVDSSK